MLNRIRNIRKRWLVVWAAVAVLALGLVSGVAFAASGPAHYIVGGDDYHHGSGYGHHGMGEHGHGANSQLMARVAEILGIEQTTLEAAFTTAKAGQMDARFATYTDELVADETLTQEQADAAKTWFGNRPAEAGKVAWLAIRTAESEPMQERLARLVTAGALTQEQADAIASWHGNRPDTLPEKAGHGKGRHGHK